MKTLAKIAAAAILAPLIATAQNAARDVARQMGADTTTSISPGLDRHDIHRDTETVERARQHVPNLLQSAQESKPKNPSKARKKDLPRRSRNTSRSERNAISQTAAVTAQKANDSPTPSFMTTKSTTESSMGAGGVATAEGRTKAETEQGAKRLKQLKTTNGAARERSEDTEIRLHAPSLLNPK
jgi:hypothetical protein